MNRKCIAIIEPFYLMANGLKAILDGVMPFAEVLIFETFEDFKDSFDSGGDGAPHFVHFFVSSSIVFKNADFFGQMPQVTVVLLNGDTKIHARLHPLFRFLDISQKEPQLIKSLLALHQSGHPSGHPATSPMAHSAVALSSLHTTPLSPMEPLIKVEEVISSENKTDEAVLSDREIEVLKLVAQGFLNKEIADRLNIAVTTVISHRQNITGKLKLKSVSALTVYAVVNGYVDYSSVYKP